MAAPVTYPMHIQAFIIVLITYGLWLWQKTGDISEVPRAGGPIHLRGALRGGWHVRGAHRAWHRAPRHDEATTRRIRQYGIKADKQAHEQLNRHKNGHQNTEHAGRQARWHPADHSL